MKIMVEEESLDLAYTAGIIDGEGCIGIYKITNKRSFQAKVRVGSTDEELVLWLQDTYGGHINLTNWTTAGRPFFTWDKSDSDIIGFLESILPYLRIKKPQAEIALRFQERKLRTLWCPNMVLNEADCALIHSLKKPMVEER